MTVTPFIGVCFFDGPVSATPCSELWHRSGESLFQSFPHTIASHSHLSLDGVPQDVPQSFVQFGKIKAMVYAAQDDGA
jgi:hypothetical protein